MAKVTVNYSVSTWEGGDNYSSEFKDEAEALKFVSRQLKNNRWGSPHVNEIIIHKEPVPELTLDEIAALMENNDIMVSIKELSVAHADGDSFFRVASFDENGAEAVVLSFRSKKYKVVFRNGTWDYAGVTEVQPKEETVTRWV